MRQSKNRKCTFKKYLTRPEHEGQHMQLLDFYFHLKR